jgi:tetratricopeptide (TPR) repeat protein
MSLNKVLSRDEIDAIRENVLKLSDSKATDAAWETAAPLLGTQAHDEYAAGALLEIVNRDCLSREQAVAALEAIEATHTDDVRIVSLIAENVEKAIDINFLNAAPPELPLLSRTIERLSKAWKRGAYDDETSLLDGLATAARLFGRQKDDLAERAYKRLVELAPETHYHHYNYGLFLKTRGRFEEGMHANQRAAALSKEPSEATRWNLGICATGAGKGEIALQIWKDLGHTIEMGRFELPDGRFPSCKIRLAERPLAERTSENDDPGQEETIWIQRLSACHGIIRSVLYYDLGVNYGDVILFDGAPVT